MVVAPTQPAIRERRPSAPTTKRALSSSTSPPAVRATIPVTRPVAFRSTPVAVMPVDTVAPASRAASTRSASRACRRGATSMSTPLRSLITRVVSVSPERNVTWRTAGAPPSRTASIRPQRASCTTPPRAMPCVDTVSLGKLERSTTATSCPARASSIAVDAPAQRDPTTITSWWLRSRLVMAADTADKPAQELGDDVEVVCRLSRDQGRRWASARRDSATEVCVTRLSTRPPWIAALTAGARTV